MPIDAEAHDVLPKEFAKEFKRAGIEVHDPKFGAWWDKTAHRDGHKTYNAEWEEFLSGSPSPEGILDFGRKMAADYGFAIHF